MTALPDDVKHTKFKTSIPTAPDTWDIITASYHEEPTSYKREITQHFKTSRDTFLSDLIASVDVVSNKQTHEVTIIINTDEHFMPKLITRTHTVKKESFHNH